MSLPAICGALKGRPGPTPPPPFAISFEHTPTPGRPSRRIHRPPLSHLLQFLHEGMTCTTSEFIHPSEPRSSLPLTFRATPRNTLRLGNAGLQRSTVA